MKTIIKVFNESAKIMFAYGLYFVLMRFNDLVIAIEYLIKKPAKTQNSFIASEIEHIIDFNKVKLSKNVRHQKISSRTLNVPPDKLLVAIKSNLNKSSHNVESWEILNLKPYYRRKNK
jgi:hypothetical protein